MANNFLAHSAERLGAASTLEIQGTALVLSGLLPPVYDLESTLENIDRVLESPASLVGLRH